jgi:branched-chain amino acid transport system ATP-binding protein
LTPMNDTGPYRKTLLRATGITKRFDALAALRGVDFDMPRHGIVSIIGPNGAGKTVLFNILTGLSKPDAGDIWFDGKRITGLPPDRITKLGIARTFQNIRLFGNMTVLENVLVGRHARMKQGVIGSMMRSSVQLAEEETARERAMDLLRFVDIDHFAETYATNLPYGAGRRLEIVRALGSEPQLLLLDEPTAGMNPQETFAIIDLIDSIRTDMGIGILLIEHDMKVVMRISDRISVLDYGVKIAEGTPEEIRSNPRVIEAYLGRGASAGREIAPEASPEPSTLDSLQMAPKPATG